MREIEDYLDRVMFAANLAPMDAKKVRSELQEHLAELLESEGISTTSIPEIWNILENKFGSPEKLGKEIARSKGRFLTLLKKEARRFKGEIFAVRAWLLAFLILLPLRTFAISPYRMATDDVSPLVPRGSWLLVNKLSTSYSPGDVVVFTGEDFKAIVAVIKKTSGSQIVISRKDGDLLIDDHLIVGKVVLQSR
jgi:hypothetical protein